MQQYDVSTHAAVYGKKQKLLLYSYSMICFRVPQRHSRSVAPFYVPFASTNYLKNEPITRMMSNANVDPSFILCK